MTSETGKAYTNASRIQCRNNLSRLLRNSLPVFIFCGLFYSPSLLPKQETPQTDLAGMCLPEKSSAQGLSSREACVSGTDRTDFRSPICCSESSLCLSQQDPHLLAGREERAASLLHGNDLCAHCTAKS